MNRETLRKNKIDALLRAGTDEPISSQSEICTVYADGSVDAVCSKCGSWEHLKPGHKLAQSIAQGSGYESSFTCLMCWKKAKEEKPTYDDIRRDDIHWGQSFNLAVSMVVASIKPGTGSESMTQIKKVAESKELIAYWQQYFYDALSSKYKGAASSAQGKEPA